MKYIVLIICLCSLAFGLTYNLNDDCCVNAIDYAYFAADFNSVYDVNDLADFAAEWLEFEPTDSNRTPIVNDQTDIAGNDANVTYYITATDETATEFTYYVESITTEAGTIQGASSFPYELSGNSFVYEPNSAFEGTCIIRYSADDGSGLNAPCGGKGIGIATITVLTPAPPVVNAAADVNVLQFVREKITLNATDEGSPNPPGKLKYIITDLPTSGTLQDPKSGAGIISSVPYTLSTHGNVVWFFSDTAGADSFQWKANDYLDDSNTQTIDVNVIANPQDCLEFDGTGYITFADNAKYDLANGWAMDFWINTTSPFAGICKKRDANGVGYELNLIHGKPQFEIYDSNGLVAQARSYARLDNGFWNEITVVFNHLDPNGLIIQLESGIGGENGYGYLAGGIREGFAFPELNDVNVSWANTADLTFGLSSYSGFKGSIDKLRFFSGMSYPMLIGDLTQGLSERTESIDEQILGIGKISDVLFMMDEGTGTGLTDSKLCLTGTISDTNNVKWTPSIKVFTDNSIKTFYYYKEKTKWKRTSNGF